MKAMALLKKLAWIFAAIGILLIFVVLDWLPTIKDLSRLRREQGNEALKIKNFAALASGFVFPDQEEKSLFAENNARLRLSLPQMHDNNTWLAMALLELQAQVKADDITNARVFFTFQAMGTELGAAVPGQPAVLVEWLPLQILKLRESFYQNRYPWHGVFSSLEFVRKQQLASCELAVALAAPLPALLDFINHISWGETRLEIVRMHLEPGPGISRAWLICRGNYLVREPSAPWAVKEVSGTVGDNLLVDPDSPLLWQKVNREMMLEVSRNELPPVVPKPK